MYGLDLFSGIGGITRALDGYVRPVAYCDIEPYSRSVLLSRMATGDLPIAPVWADVTTLRGNMLPRIDIIYGGFPCQDLSLAGRRAGLDGSRSGLFFQILRLAKETGAPFIFLENVPGIRTKGLGRVLKELDKLGYDARWGLLSAADVGANHKRERWFLLAHAKCLRWRESGPLTDQAGQPIFPTERSKGALRLGSSGPIVADTSRELRERSGTSRDGRAESTDGGWWAIEPNVGRVADGVPKRVDRLRALGNAVVSAQVREAFERLMGLKRVTC